MSERGDPVLGLRVKATPTVPTEVGGVRLGDVHRTSLEEVDCVWLDRNEP